LSLLPNVPMSHQNNPRGFIIRVFLVALRQNCLDEKPAMFASPFCLILAKNASSRKPCLLP
jgi:hypothetical protein